MVPVIVALVLSAGLLVLKGWWLLILGPAAFVYLPVTAGLQQWVRKRKLGWILAVAHVQLLATLLFILCLPAMGDTEGTVVLGFVKTADHSPLAETCATLSEIGAYTLVTATVVLLGAMMWSWIRRRWPATP